MADDDDRFGSTPDSGQHPDLVSVFFSRRADSEDVKKVSMLGRIVSSLSQVEHMYPTRFTHENLTFLGEEKSFTVFVRDILIITLEILIIVSVR
uniref:Uncharacterized protein n=1 Tax=Trichogramma kaykai TaxID=54128 RepID=A0ABD2XF00_9HYME